MKQRSQHRGRDVCSCPVSLLVQDVEQQPVACVLEQHLAAFLVEEFDCPVPIAPRKIMRAAQFVRDIIEGLEILHDRDRVVCKPHLPDAAAEGLDNQGRVTNAPPFGEMRLACCQCVSPSIRSIFWTAAPEAPLPRLS